jgi:fatty acid desaturase
MPAARQFGTLDGLGVAAAIFGLPIFALLAITGFPYYGALQSLAVAALVTVISCAVGWVVVVFTFAAALSGTVAGVVLTIVLFGVPLLCVAIFGLLALRIAENRLNAPHVAGAAGAR